MKKLFAMMMVALAFAFTATAVYADTSAEIQARMKERAPTVRKLKSEGKIGEDNKGYLGYPSASGKDAETDKVVTAENADRKKVYAAIAKKEKTTTEAVGERRAIQNAQNAKAGEYVQGKDGKWTKKAAKL